MKRVVGIGKTTNYKTSLLTSGGVCGKTLEKDLVVLLDGKYEVTVKSQRLFANYTMVKMGSKEFEVSTKRLVEKE